MKTTYPLVGQVGMLADLPSQELPPGAWSNSGNMRFRDGAAERFRGETQIFDAPVVQPYYLQPFVNNNKRWWIHAGTAAVYADNGADPRVNITPAAPPTGGVDNYWTGGTLNGVAVMNNGVDVPLFWLGTGILAPLTNWQTADGYRAKVLRPYRNVLVALDITKTVGGRFPHMVKWSDPANPGQLPGSWNQNDLTKLAGEYDLAEEPSLMVDCLPLGDANIIYKENAMFAMTPTGGVDVFRFQRLRDGGSGLLARGCVADTPKGHVVLTNGDLVIHQGGEPTSIVNGRMRRWLFRNIDSTNRKRAFVVQNPAAAEVWACFPELGATECTLALVWNWVDNTLGVRTLPRWRYAAVGQLEYGVTQTWAAQQYPWGDAVGAWAEDQFTPAQNRLIAVTQTPSVVAVDIGATFAGAVYSSVLERTGMAFNTPDKVKLFKSLRLRVDGTMGATLQVELGGQLDMEDGVQWSPPVTYTIGSTFSADAFATGRFLAIRVTSLDNQPYRIRSMDVEYEVLGDW